MQESKTNARYTIDIANDARARLVELATAHKVTQGEVIEAMLTIAGESDQLATALEAAREQKATSRAAKRTEKKKIQDLLRGLTPEQLAAAVAVATGKEA